MSSGKIKIVLFLIVFLLVLAVVCNVLIDLSESRSNYQYAPTQAPSDTTDTTGTNNNPSQPGSSGTVSIETAPPTRTPSGTTPIYTAPPQLSTPIPTVAPTPTATPVPTPEVTPIPTSTIIGTGEFASDTGVPLNLVASWTAEVIDSSTVKVTVSVDLDSYSLYISESPAGVFVSVGDQYKSAGTPSVSHGENTRILTHLATTEHTIKLSDGNSVTVPLAVEYHFGGVYKKVELPVIECGGDITLSR